MLRHEREKRQSCRLKAVRGTIVAHQARLDCPFVSQSANSTSLFHLAQRLVAHELKQICYSLSYNHFAHIDFAGYTNINLIFYSIRLYTVIHIFLFIINIILQSRYRNVAMSQNNETWMCRNMNIWIFLSLSLSVYKNAIISILL